MKLLVRDLSVVMSLGVHDWEKESPRTVTLNLEAQFDGRAAGISDAIADTVDYTAIEQAILSIAAARHYELIESFIHTLGLELLQRYSRLDECTITVDKPGALRQAQSVAISETFSR